MNDERRLLYGIWWAMHHRCESPDDEHFAQYGARGITVCARWSSFDTFLADMGPRQPGLTLDRRDNDGPYSPENCRWATRTEQNRNRRGVHVLSCQGEARTLAEWAERLGVDRRVLMKRMALGWPVEAVVGRPLRPGRPSRRATPLSAAERDAVRALAGMPSRLIAERFNVSKTTVLKILKDAR